MKTLLGDLATFAPLVALLAFAAVTGPLSVRAESLGEAFSPGTAFPTKHRGTASVGLHGSWNHEKRTGSEVIILPVRAGEPTGDYEAGRSLYPPGRER